MPLYRFIKLMILHQLIFLGGVNYMGVIDCLCMWEEGVFYNLF